MTTLHPCEKVGLDFIASAPHRYANSVDLALTPEQLFEVLADAEAWPRWARVITDVEEPAPLHRRAVRRRPGRLSQEGTG